MSRFSLWSSGLQSFTVMVTTRMGVDRAVLFGILQRVWGLISGPISLILIASRFSPETQGYYYTFNSLLAVTIFFELGLGTVIQQFASHEWAYLKLDVEGRIIGEPAALSRLAGLARVSLRWYTIIGLVATIGLGVFGFVFFSRQPQHDIRWEIAWLVLSLFSGINLALVPFWSLLEGCNQINKTYIARFVGAVLASIGGWVSIWLGAGLWTASIISIVLIAVAITFFKLKYSRFIRSLLSDCGKNRINWKYEIWPMQWRIALSWLSGYFIFNILTPVVFYFCGAITAGKMGMTWSLVNMLLAIGLTWMATKAPIFGMLIAKHNYSELDRLFIRSLIQEMTVVFAMGLFLWLLIFFLNVMGHRFAQRFLAPLPTAALILAIIAHLPVNAMATYLRAHKQEPYLLTSLFAGVLVSISTVLLAKLEGAEGVAIGYFVCMLVVLIPNYRIFRLCRKKWHKIHL